MGVCPPCLHVLCGLRVGGWHITVSCGHTAWVKGNKANNISHWALVFSIERTLPTFSVFMKSQWALGCQICALCLVQSMEAQDCNSLFCMISSAHWDVLQLWSSRDDVRWWCCCIIDYVFSPMVSCFEHWPKKWDCSSMSVLYRMAGFTRQGLELELLLLCTDGVWDGSDFW